MLSMQHSHRLPADHDMNLIRTRVAERGPLWHDVGAATDFLVGEHPLPVRAPER